MGNQGKIARTQSRKKIPSSSHFLSHLDISPLTVNEMLILWPERLTLDEIIINLKKFLRPNHSLICSKTLVELKKLFLFVYECEIRTEPEININFYFMALLLCKFALITSNVL